MSGADEAIRLAKRVAALKGCSRSEAERYIEGGWVRVDGQGVEDPATRVLPAQTVELDAHATLLDDGPATVLLYKPAGVQAHAGLITAQARSARDTSGKRWLRKHLHGLQSLAPLPAGTGGLVVFTQERHVQRRLIEDADLLEHEFMADVAGAVADTALQALRQSQRLDGRVLPPVRASVSSTGEGRTRLRLAFKGFDPAQLQGLCAAAGLTLQALTRQRLGRVALGGLAPGQWRHMLSSERF